MAEMTFDEQWLQSSEQHSAPLEDISKVTVVDPSTLSSATVLMSLPGVEFDKDPSVYPSTAKPVKFVQFHLSTLISLYQSLNQTVTTATGDLVTVKNAAVQATQDAIAATDEAEMVDATLEGMTVTITSRTGVSHSTNIGFEIYRTYPSVAAMKADAANVPQGKFVIIATLDPTDPDNAQLWGRNSEPATSQNPFTFLSDLDQASSAAWADWLNNMKPEIIDATDAANAAAGRVDDCIATANADHTRAESDHSTASQDHTTATTDHTTATQDHSTATSDHTIAVADHTVASTDHSVASSDHVIATTDHSTATTDHTVAATDHNTATQDHTRAESDHTRAEQDHSTATSDHTTATSDHDISASQQSTFEANEAQRQSDFEDNEAQRQQDFEDGEAARMAAMVVTHCYVDVATMCLKFVTPASDTTEYKVRNGDLNIIVTYEE